MASVHLRAQRWDGAKRLVGAITSLIGVLTTRAPLMALVSTPPPPRLPRGLRLRQMATPGWCYCSPEPLKG